MGIDVMVCTIHAVRHAKGALRRAIWEIICVRTEFIVVLRPGVLLLVVQLRQSVHEGHVRFAASDFGGRSTSGESGDGDKGQCAKYQHDHHELHQCEGSCASRAYVR
jgi:hypothetical protein